MVTTFNGFIDQLVELTFVIKNNIPLTLKIVAVFWVVFFVSLLTGYRLNMLGIYPRKSVGLPGIAFNTFLHGNFNHLFFNSIPLLVLIAFTLNDGWYKFIYVSLTIIILSGIAVWCFGRRGLHIGASGLIMGYWGYLLVNAYRHPTLSTIILAIVCLYYFGGFLLNLFPREERVSWEGHLFGFLAGVFAAFYWG